MSEPALDDDASRTPRAGGAPIDVCMLGSTASGKTCLIAGLAVLAEPDRKTSLRLHATGTSKERLEELADSLRGGVWPPPTNTMENLTFEVVADRSVARIAFYDYPGEDFQRLFFSSDNMVSQRLRDSLQLAQVLILVLDIDRDVKDTNHEAVKRRDALLSAITQIRLQAAKGDSSRPDVAIVLTKVDRQPEIASEKAAKELLRSHCPHFYEKLAEYGSWLRVFPVSAVGDATASEGASRPPQRLEPRGYESLFGWVIHYRQRRNRRRRGRGLIAVGIVAALFCGGYLLSVKWASDYVRAVLNDPNRPITEKIGDTRVTLPLDADALSARQESIRRLLDDLESRAAAAPNEVELLAIAGEVADSLQNESAGGRVNALLQAIEQRKEELRWERLRDTQSSLAEVEYLKLADQFLSDYPASKHKSEVDAWREGARRRILAKQRHLVANTSASSPQGCREKAKLMRTYLERSRGHESAAEAQRIARAAELADLFAAENNYELVIKSVGRFADPHAHGLVVKIGDSDPIELWSRDASRQFTPDRTYQVPWRVGEPVKVDWYYDGYFNNPHIATLVSRSPIAIADLVGLSRMTLLAPEYVQEANLRSEVNKVGRQPLTADDWEIVRDFIYPGTKWTQTP